MLPLFSLSLFSLFSLCNQIGNSGHLTGSCRFLFATFLSLMDFLLAVMGTLRNISVMLARKTEKSSPFPVDFHHSLWYCMDVT